MTGTAPVIKETRQMRRACIQFILQLHFLLLGSVALAFGSFHFSPRADAKQGRLHRLPNGNNNYIQQFMSARVGETEDFGMKRDPLWQKRANRWVLIVDDEEAIRKAVGQLLFDRGYQVTACADARTALKVALNRRNDQDEVNRPIVPDCIVSDVRMPGMDGLEFLRNVRSNDKLVEVPVILLTAKSMIQDRIAGYDSGADSYLPKPFDPEELVAIIDNIIDRHETLGSNVQVEDLKRDLDEIKYLLLEKGGGGVGNGWVEQTNVFLAPDEREVLKLLCQGLMSKEIAEKTFLSTRRVEQLLTRMFRKTNVKNRTELVRWAVSTGNVHI
jgi:DNA-binding NarL/FixJ family response regulator